MGSGSEVFRWRVNGAVERCGAHAGALAPLGERTDDSPNELDHLGRVLGDDFHHLGTAHLPLLLPGVKICHDHDRGLADLRLAQQHRHGQWRHGGVGVAFLLTGLRLRPRGKTRALDDDGRAAVVEGVAKQLVPDGGDDLGHLRTDGGIAGNVDHEPTLVEEGFLPDALGHVQELIGQAEVARLDLALEAAPGAEVDHHRDSELLQREGECSVVDLRRVEHVPSVPALRVGVTVDEHDLLAGEISFVEHRRSERSVEAAPFDVLEARQLLQVAAADDRDLVAGIVAHDHSPSPRGELPVDAPCVETRANLGYMILSALSINEAKFI